MCLCIVLKVYGGHTYLFSFNIKASNIEWFLNCDTYSPCSLGVPIYPPPLPLITPMEKMKKRAYMITRHNKYSGQNKPQDTLKKTWNATQFSSQWRSKTRIEKMGAWTVFETKLTSGIHTFQTFVRTKRSGSVMWPSNDVIRDTAR